MRQQQRAYLYALVTVLLWSTVASAFKISLRHLEPIQLLLYATVVSIVVLTAVVAAQGKLRLVFACTRRQYAQSILLGALNPFLYYLVLFEAYDRLDAQVAQPLNYTWAIALALLSIPLLRQRIGPRPIVAGLVAYCGVWVICTGGGDGDVPGTGFKKDAVGVALALGSTIIWALFWIYHTRDRRDPAVALLLNFVFALPLIVVVTCCLLSPDDLLVVPDHRGLLGAAYVGAFEMGVTFVLWLSALKLSRDTARVANLIFISPFLSLVFIHYLVGEEIAPATWIGLVFIVAGLVIQGTGRRAAKGN